MRSKYSKECLDLIFNFLFLPSLQGKGFYCAINISNYK